MDNSTKTIVYIITQLELGGAQKICLSLFENFSSTPYSSYLLSSNEGILANQVKSNPRVFLTSSLKRSVSLTSLFAECKAFIVLTKQLRIIKKKHPACIVHTHSTKAGILGRWAAWAAGIKIRVHTIHGFAFHSHQSWITWLPIYIIELLTSFITSHFICVSSYDQRTGTKLFPFFRKKNSLIRAAIPLENFEQSEKPQKKTSDSKSFIIGSISCFKPQKNLFDLLHAFQLVHKKYPYTTLEIIGDGQLRNGIEAWIEYHKLSSIITLHGWQPTVVPFLQKWQLFALSSLWEGLPCAIVEARFMKLPVVCYNTGGISDFIVHDSNGYLVPQRNIKQLAQKIELLIQNKELYTRLATHSDFFDDFSNTSMIKHHEKLYTQLHNY